MRVIFPYMARWRSANRSRYHQLLTELARQGHEVHVFQAPPLTLGDISFTDLDTPLDPEIHLHEIVVPTGLWNHRLPSEKILKKGILSLATRSQLQAFAAQHPDSLLMLYNLPQVGLMSLPGVTVHFDLADNLVAMLEREMGRPGRLGPDWIARQVQARMVNGARSTTVAARSLLNQGGPRAAYLPNGASLADLAQTDAVSERNGLSGPVVGFLGAFEYWIDTPLLRQVAQRLPQVHFLLAGGGRHWQQIQAGLSDLPNISMPGALPNRRGLNLIAAMDICLIPFTRDPVSNDSCPLKLFEYAGLCKPIISTRLHEVTRIGQGWVRFADSAEETVDAIQDLLAHPAQARALGEQGRQQVEQTYNWTRLAREFCRIVQKQAPDR